MVIFILFLIYINTQILFYTFNSILPTRIMTVVKCMERKNKLRVISL